MFNLAKDYEYGNGVMEDISKAFELYLKAAQAGNADAMCHVGYLMMFGYGVERHTRNALYWMDQGISNSKNPDSKYYKNAIKIKEKITTSSSQLPYETKYTLMVEKINDYNKIATKIGYMPLCLNNNHLLGSGIDLFSNYMNDSHYINYVKLRSWTAPKGIFASFKFSFHQGELANLFLTILGDLYDLQID